MRVSIHYPVNRGRLVLRTADDWDRDVEPIAATATQAIFDVDNPGHFLELKPCLRDGDTVTWARGSNEVITRHERDRRVWPFFFSAEHGHVSDLTPVAHDGVTRQVRVYYPPGYEENTLRRYPVIYMQDGRNLFFPEEAFAGNEWRVDETMDRLDRMNAIRKCVVVGISSQDRQHDYTKPGYDDYGRFVVEALKPWIDASVRTRPEPAATVVMGSSLGGVAALHLGWTWPHVFGRVACMSSTFGVFDDLFERVANQPKRELLIYLDSGWPKDNFEATNAMRDLLIFRGYRLGVDLLQFGFPDGLHDEDSWAARIHLPFQFFFGRAWLSQRGDQ